MLSFVSSCVGTLSHSTGSILCSRKAQLCNPQQLKSQSIRRNFQFKDSIAQRRFASCSSYRRSWKWGIFCSTENQSNDTGDTEAETSLNSVTQNKERKRPIAADRLFGLIESDPPRATYFFLIANVVLYALEVYFDTQKQFGGNLILAYGAKINEAIIAGEYWRLVTPVFLHGGLVHLGLNSLALFQLGPQVEMAYGTATYIWLYLISGMFGNLLSFLFTPGLSIGASGAIFGLVGAWGAYLYTHESTFGARGRKMLNNLIFIVGLNLLIGLEPPLDNWSHIGGLVFGCFFAIANTPKFVVPPEVQRLLDEQNTQRPPSLAAVPPPTPEPVAPTVTTTTSYDTTESSLDESSASSGEEQYETVQTPSVDTPQLLDDLPPIKVLRPGPIEFNLLVLGFLGLLLLGVYGGIFSAVSQGTAGVVF